MPNPPPAAHSPRAITYYLLTVYPLSAKILSPGRSGRRPQCNYFGDNKFLCHLQSPGNGYTYQVSVKIFRKPQEVKPMSMIRNLI